MGQTQVRNECDMNDTSATQVKNFDFDNYTSENIISHLYISYMVNDTLQSEEEIHYKKYLLEMLCTFAKLRLKGAPQKLNFVMTKTISQSYALDYSCKCSCTFPHSYG